MAHTPGPWAVSSRASRRVTSTFGIVICNAVLRNVGSAKSGLKHGAKASAEAEANARLIAAAPDYAEVAPDAADLLDEYAAYVRTVKADELERHPYLPEIERVVSALRAAIAKAGAA